MSTFAIRVRYPQPQRAQIFTDYDYLDSCQNTESHIGFLKRIERTRSMVDFGWNDDAVYDLCLRLDDTGQHQLLDRTSHLEHFIFIEDESTIFGLPFLTARGFRIVARLRSPS